MRLWAFLCAAVLVLASCGSAPTPTQRWALAREALTTGQDTVLALHASGVVSDRELLEIDPVVQTARASLSVAESQLPDGGKTFEDYMAVVQAGLGRLAEIESTRIGGK